MLDVPAASRIAANGSEGEHTSAVSLPATDTDAVHNTPLPECHASEVPHNRNNTIVMAQLASFAIELEMMEKPDRPAELELEVEKVRAFHPRLPRVVAWPEKTARTPGNFNRRRTARGCPPLV